MALSLSGNGDISTSANTNISLPTSGLVLKPNHRLAFLAARTGGDQSVAVNGLFIFNTLLYEVGTSMYNTSTGIMTAPEDGLYFISANLLTPNNTTIIDTRLLINDIDINFASYSGNWNGHKTNNFILVYFLNSGDTVKIKANNNATTLWGTGGYHSWFNVCFLG